MFTGMLVLAGLVGAAVVGFLVWFVPWLWELIKPWLHAVTA
ncbi:hypothetical protein [Xanthomonas translucens]|nr:hypothetical protein [Xanthomonas translucens]